MEPFECWESLDSKFLRDLLLLGGVNLGNKEWWIVFGESFSSLDVFWGKLFAVTAKKVNMVRACQKKSVFVET